jgi:methionyl aminopeptidase
MREAGRLASEVIDHVTPHVKAGVTTGELDRICHEYMRDVQKTIPAPLNYQPPGYPPFPASICTSVNDVICHGIPGKLELRDGDIVNIDITTIFKGYFGDTSKMFLVGDVSDHAKKLVKVTKECLSIGIQQCKAGTHLNNIGFYINAHATSHGYSTVYEFCGHGVGMRFHEEPEVCHIADKGTGPILQPGMTFTIEPMINAGKARAKIDRKDGWTARTIDGRLSAQFEHTICITKSDPFVLTDIDNEFPKPQEIF